MSLVATEWIMAHQRLPLLTQWRLVASHSISTEVARHWLLLKSHLVATSDKERQQQWVTCNFLIGFCSTVKNWRPTCKEPRLSSWTECSTKAGITDNGRRPRDWDKVNCINFESLKVFCQLLSLQVTKKINPNSINFRVLRESTTELIQSLLCLLHLSQNIRRVLTVWSPADKSPLATRQVPWTT